MKYLLMLYAEEKVGMALPPDQMAGFMAQLAAYQDTLKKAGAFVTTAALQPTHSAKTISKADGELKVHDGPYAETREQFGGFYIIEARDMTEALEWAKQCPAAQWGPVEVRAMIPGY